jgi:hypothetical protein
MTPLIRVTRSCQSFRFDSGSTESSQSSPH